MRFIKKTCVSIVSHGQWDLVLPLLRDLEKYSEFISIIILTLNLPESIDTKEFKNNILVIKNTYPKGFGANHNQAFKYFKGAYFFILNPDIRINTINFEGLLSKFSHEKSIGIVVPTVTDSKGNLEDHVREFPTIFNTFMRFLGLHFFKKTYNSKIIRPLNYKNNPTDQFWVAGMAMIFKKNTFQLIDGFDERFFMYLEDIDICKRLINNKYKIFIDKENRVIHNAQRESRKNIKLFFIHLNSLLKYFVKWGLFK